MKNSNVFSHITFVKIPVQNYKIDQAYIILSLISKTVMYTAEFFTRAKNTM